jgi:2-oxo-4-hydroxy-4-carboxy-5-ureidoimidazoline decarboxylase
MLYSMAKLNQLGREEFVKCAGEVFEHSPWVAERAWRHRPFESFDQLCERMNGEVNAASVDERLALLRAHPDLGTRAKISLSSAGEQAGAGLDQLTAEEYRRLTTLNAAYREKFGFPFLFAVKGSGKSAILEALQLRLGAAREDEFQEALRQVFRIARFRLEAILDRP